jgi:hypothetical protein
MKDQSKTHMYKIGNALLTTPGDTNPVQRGHIIDYVVSKTLGLGENPESFESLDRSVFNLVDKVTFAAYSIEDEDMILLRDSGWSDDAVYEIVLTAAYGAGLARMQMLYSLLNDPRR